VGLKYPDIYLKKKDMKKRRKKSSEQFYVCSGKRRMMIAPLGIPEYFIAMCSACTWNSAAMNYSAILKQNGNFYIA
jgi:hypothetical protein